jgi:hypothetical protein
MLNLETRNEIIFHFNKKHLEDSSVPMWVIKTKGETYYVNHLEVDKGVGFSSKETPDNPHTKGSLKFKGRLRIEGDNGKIIAKIY